MKKKHVKRLLSLALTVALVGTMLPSGFYVKAETIEEQTVSESSIGDDWTQDENNIVGEDAVCAVEDGWLHLRAGSGNGNNPGTKPAIFVNSNSFDFTQQGYFEFIMKSNNANSGRTDSDRFGVYLGYATDATGMFLGYDNGGWFWQKYGADGSPWYSGSRVSAPGQGVETKVRIDWTADKTATLTIDDTVVFDQEDFSGIADLGNQIAFKCGRWNEAITDVLIKDIHYTGQAEAANYAVSGTVVDENGDSVKDASVKIGTQTTTTDENGAYTFEAVAAGTYTMTVTASGYEPASKEVVVADQAVTVETITLVKTSDVETEMLSTEDMDVYVSKTFPSVVRYEMKGELAGKVFYGQSSKISTIRINGTDVVLEDADVVAAFEADKAVYTMTVKKGQDIDAVITAELVAKDNTVAFNITNIENKLEDTVDGNPVQSIEIPNHSLISVNSTQEGANLKGARMSSNTTISGDDYVALSNDTAARTQDYMYAFISNRELSAGLWSNSENEGSAKSVGVAGGSHNTRIMSVTEAEDDHMKIGLGSTKWYYHRIETDSKNVRHMVEETDMPKAKIVITGDQNGDDQIDWQDGAVAFRSIMNNPYKSEEVPELVAWRIAMNFGGQAQNPFLTTLDNVKRVAMHTDGLGQSVLLKGYGNEGHDSGHPDYADIGERIGGAEDMNTLMEKGAEYGARFGIHVNAGEMYPEAKAFSDDLVRRDANGNLRYGWNWIDQGVGIDSVYDLGMGLRKARFDALKEKVGDNMDFVYVDIWGNKTGGSDDSWQTRKLSKEINDNGWRMATEWGSANEYDSTFQHWATDLTYGGYKLKGENSEVMRFLRNHQKDSWVGDYPTYKGAAMAPLLGGYNMKDFEGWQGRNDYDTYITNLYTHDLTTKFIQHYEIIKWVDGETFTDTNPDGAAYTWTPEMEITLKDEDGNTLVLERGSDNPADGAYRDRTMTLNGKVIATGAVSPGNRSNAEIQNGQRKGTETYLLPWFWDAQTGERVSSDDEKLYHWNTQGGETSWELPDSWSSLKNVVVYKLTDLGKTEETEVEVVNGRITLTAESEIPYVVYKGEKGNLDITWSEGMHIVDAGFNSGNFNAWEKAGEGTAEIAKSQYSNPMMKLTGAVSMTQTLTELKAGQQYAVLVGVDNRSDSEASMTVKCGDEVLATNYTVRSIAKNYVKAYTHSNSSATVDGSSYFQNMYVFFTAPASGNVTLTLAKAAGEGATYFDDVRIVENDSKNITTNDKGQIVKFEQDFETSVQGLYPFVVGGIEGVEDNRIHLSELHAPYTQAGWDVKMMDDVLDGNWSVKINGLTERNALCYQTIPQNFRFEPGVTYKVSFDYQAGSDNTYAVIVGSGEYSGATNPDSLPMHMGKDADGHYECEVVGDITGQTWIGIYSTGTAPNLQGTSGAAANFGGYKELVLDNLVIERVERKITEADLEALVEEAESRYDRENYTLDDWKYLEVALTDAKVALHRDVVSMDEIEEAFYALNGAVNYMDGISTAPEETEVNDISLDGVVITAGSEGSFGTSGGAKELAIDGDSGTAWMTPYDNYSNWSKLGLGWLDLQFPEAHTVDGFRYLPAQDGCGYAPQSITEYEIQVKTEGSDTYQTVAEGTWANDRAWKLVAFENAVENVTNVKLIAKKASPSNWWATAAEIRVTSEAEKVIENLPVDMSELNQLVSTAKKLNKADYTAETWAVLETKFAAAQEVLADTGATRYDVLLAAANLSDAMNGLEEAKQPEPGQGDKTALDKFYKECLAYYKEANHSGTNWKAYQKALAEVQAVLADPNATQGEVDAALKALTEITKSMNKELKDNSETPGTGDKNNGTGAAGNQGIAATGDLNTVATWIWIALAFVSISVIGVMRRRKENI